MPYYAQLNDDSACKAVVETSGELTVSNCIQLDSLDNTLLGKIYNPQSGQFEDAAD